MSSNKCDVVLWCCSTGLAMNGVVKKKTPSCVGVWHVELDASVSAYDRCAL